MPRIRTIKPEFWTDEKLSTVPLQARLIFIACWNYADDSGILKGSPLFLKSMILPYDYEITLADFNNWLNTLIEQDIIIPFKYNGEQFIYIKNFSTHQKIDRPSKPLIEFDTLIELINEYSPNMQRLLVSGKERKGKEQGKDMEWSGKEFARPSEDEVILFFKKNWDEKKSKEQADGFLNYYDARGWKIKGEVIESWTAAAAGWVKKEKEFSNNNQNKNNYDTSRTVKSERKPFKL